MSTDKKLIFALGVLAVLGVVYFMQTKKQAAEAETYTYEGQQAKLPKLGITEDAVKKIDKIVIQAPKEDEKAGGSESHTLVKNGEEWKLDEPAKALANQANVKSLLDNLKSLEVTELINASKDAYKSYDVTDDKAVIATFYKGKDVAYQFHFGQSGGRGQMTRIKGQDGTFAVKGYSKFLYARDTKGWRDLTIFKFEDDKAKSVEITNESGLFSFTKDGEAWKAKFKKKGALAATDIAEFDEAKVKDLLRAYKALNANAFGDGKQPADVGLTEPVATVTITLDDGAKRELLVGGTGEGSSRWVKLPNKDDIYAVSSWAADWATAEPTKFQKKKDDDKGDDAEGGDDGDMPGMPQMPMMPPGHP